MQLQPPLADAGGLLQYLGSADGEKADLHIGSVQRPNSM